MYMNIMDIEIESWIKRMPKVELHAHLSGSISDRIIRKLLEKEEFSETRKSSIALLNQPRSLENCFSIFPVIHSLIKDQNTLHYVVTQVLTEFQDDDVVYLELRTTPRTSEQLSAFGYLDTILRSISEFHEKNQDGLICRLLLSIDRSKPIDNAWNTVRIAERFLCLPNEDVRSNLIVGFELSGNPRLGIFEDFVPVLNYVRKSLRLPVSLHFAEVDNEPEALQMINYQPERLGHGAILSEKVLHSLSISKIPVEVCLTSNILTRTVDSLEEHPAFKYLSDLKHPISICTDDSGLFQTNSSTELSMYVRVLNLSEIETKRIIMSSLQQIFCKDRSIVERIEKRFS